LKRTATSTIPHITPGRRESMESGQEMVPNGEGGGRGEGREIENDVSNFGDEEDIIPLTITTLPRCHYIDLFRGLAISIMLQANLIPYIDAPFSSLPPLYLRMIYSLAAPIFIFLSGYSAMKFSTSNRMITTSVLLPFSVQRVLFSGVFIDISVWFLYPFQTYDVLYIIALNIFTIHHLQTYSIYWSYGFFLVIFLLWIFYSFFGSYRFHVESLYISQTEPIDDYLLNCLLHFLFDGWFPFLPWILIGWLGYLQVRVQFLSSPWYKVFMLIISLATTVIYLHFSSSGGTGSGSSSEVYNKEDREGYQEIFYPVTLLYFFWSYSTVLSGYFIFESLEIYIEQSQQYNPLCLFGRNSLLVYLLHSQIICYLFIIAEWPSLALTQNWFGYFFLYFVILFIAYLREYWIPNVKRIPLILRLVTGI
jgi:uncharacterized membrane protein